MINEEDLEISFYRKEWSDEFRMEILHKPTGLLVKKEGKHYRTVRSDLLVILEEKINKCEEPSSSNVIYSS